MRALLTLLLVGMTAACGSRDSGGQPLRLLSPSYIFTIVPDESPPFARERIQYKIIVRDRENREMIETGEGQIYANNAEQASTWDGLTKGPELGTYYGVLNFVTAGQWAIAIRFRRDSVHKLETVDWMQDVYNERQAPVP